MSNQIHEKVLLVEDEPGHTRLIQRMFENNIHNWQLVTCRTVREAKTALETHTPLAILLDYKLPDDTGINFLREMTRNGHLLPYAVIILTSHGNEDMAVQAMRLGAEDYIVKTEEGFRTILQRILQAVDHWRAKREKLELQNQLRQSEATLRAYLGATSDLFCHLGEDLGLQYINDGGLKLLGRQQADLTGQKWADLFQEPDWKTAKKKFLQLKKGKIIRDFPVKVHHKKGHSIFLEMNIDRLIVDNQNKGFIVSARDITHRKVAEKEREQLVHDLHQRVKELSCLYAISQANKESESFEQLLLLICSHAEQAMQFPEDAFAEIVIKDQIFHQKSCNKNKTGYIRSKIRVNSRTIGYLEISYAKEYQLSREEEYLVHEITKRLGQIIEHRETQKKLEESEHKCRTVIHNLHDGIMLVSKSGCILEINPAFTEITGFTESEIKKISVTELFKQLLDDNSVIDVSQKNMLLIDFPVEIQTKMNEKKTVELSTKPIYDSQQNLTFIEIIVHDVTIRKLLEAELIRSKSKAEAANQMKTTFFHNISHELRTPLNTILGFTQLLLQEELRSDTREMLNFIQLSGNNLKIIINDLLDITRIEAGKTNISFSPIVTHELISFIKHEFQQTIFEKGLLLETRISPKVPKIFISDNVRLQQILTNLLTNAIKFTAQGKIAIHIELTGKNILFSVSDTGIGIPLANQKKIFDDFVQINDSTGKKGDGIGLGLSISKRIVQLLNGEISIRSNAGKGTTFYVAIPLLESLPSKDETRSLKTEPNTPLVKVLLPKRMLLVDDDPLSRKVIEHAAALWGWSIISATNGKEALDILATAFIDLIIMDLQMPVLDGYQTTRKIRNNPYNKRIPIIALTALAMESDQEKCREAGCDDFISKPVDLAQFKKIIDKWIVNVGF